MYLSRGMGIAFGCFYFGGWGGVQVLCGGLSGEGGGRGRWVTLFGGRRVGGRGSGFPTAGGGTSGSRRSAFGESVHGRRGFKSGSSFYLAGGWARHSVCADGLWSVPEVLTHPALLTKGKTLTRTCDPPPCAMSAGLSHFRRTSSAPTLVEKRPNRHFPPFPSVHSGPAELGSTFVARNDEQNGICCTLAVPQIK